jgi:hypothetical protein
MQSERFPPTAFKIGTDVLFLMFIILRLFYSFARYMLDETLFMESHNPASIE